MLDLLFMKFLSGNLDRILAVLTKLDKRLDAYIAREEAEANNLAQTRLAEREAFHRREQELVNLEAEKRAGIERADRIKGKVGDLIA